MAASERNVDPIAMQEAVSERGVMVEADEVYLLQAEEDTEKIWVFNKRSSVGIKSFFVANFSDRDLVFSV